MKNDFQKKLINNRNEFINTLFDTIQHCCSLVPYGHLHFNSTDYIYMGYNSQEKRFVPYVKTNNNIVEMYSEDGWDLEGLANWTDVAVDIISSIVSGCCGHYGYEENEAKLKR